MEEAIRILRDAIEFNSLHLLAPHIHPNCKYISQPANKEFNTKHEFIERWRKVGEAQLDQDFFLDCAKTEKLHLEFAENTNGKLDFIKLSEDYMPLAVD